MIRVTKLSGQSLVLNAELIESIEETPDTVVTLANHNRFVVQEGVDDVIARVIAYRRSLRLMPEEI
ncbi:MAG: flagellar FlbD family protein [Planctomycetes bacterium]|nr:flagellar FlbD family protein [Planctomycetota bacterium]